jgi:acyl carrier protein
MRRPGRQTGREEMTKDEIAAQVRAYIAAEFLHGESPDAISPETRLVSDGILDSLASLKLVSWLEERYGISVAAHEVDVDHLDTLDLIADLVLSKRG